MKRRELERWLRSHGAEKVPGRSRGSHETWRHTTTGAKAFIPRHRELPTGLGRAICRQLQVAAYIGAQSVIQRLNAVVPGRWLQEFRLIDPPPGAKRLYMACRLTVTLPITADGDEVEAVYEDVGEMDSGSRAGLKASTQMPASVPAWRSGSAPTSTPRLRRSCFPSVPTTVR